MLRLTKKDFKIEWFSGRGAGGQHRNKHQNCCRITHKDTGLRATGQNHRDRPSNQAEAFKKLASLVVSHYAALEEKIDYRSDERVRTYHAVRNVVTDHRSGFEQTYQHVVGKGNIGDMIDARRKVANV